MIERNNWVSKFNLVGEAVVNDYTFTIDAESKNSDYIYNRFNLGVNCGEKHGTVYAEMMGGYSKDKPGVIYAHGKDKDKRDDYENRIEVAWEDRLDDDILEDIGDACFVTVGLEKTDKDKTFYKRFLSNYDAIKYIEEHLESDMVIRVKGTLRYSTYNDVTQVRKDITSIVLSKIDDKSKYEATFTQSVLVDKYAASLKNIDKDKSVMMVEGTVLDYVKEINGKEIKGQYPFSKTFEFPMPLEKEDLCKKLYEKLFKIKKTGTVTQINFEGEFIEGGATVTATMDDVPDDIKELITLGLYTEKEALAKCSENGNREQRMLLIKPVIRMEGEDGEKQPVIQKFEEQYKEDELTEFEDVIDEDVPFEDEESTGSESSDDMDWLNNLE